MVIDHHQTSAELSFQGKDQGETFQFYYHQHAIRLFWPIFRLLLWNILLITVGVMILASNGFGDELSGRTIVILLTFFFLMAHFEFLGRFYNYLLNVIVVTDKRVHRIKKTLLTLDDHESTDLWVLQDIDKHQHGIIQNIFGYGSLILQAQDTEVRIHFTPRISEKYEYITRLREQARAHFSRAEEPFRKAKTP